MNNTYDIIYLDLPVQPDTFTLEEFIQAQIEEKFQRNGKALGITVFLEQLGKDIEAQWESLLKPYYLENLTATQKFTMNKIKVIPVGADINQVYENVNVSKDSPMSEITSTITYDYVKDSPASLSRKAFGTRKELGPRLRNWVQIYAIPEGGTTKVPMQYPVLVKRKEFVIEFKCYGHTPKEVSLMAGGLEYYIDIRKEKFYELGAQGFYYIGSTGGVEKDKDSNMFVRTVQMYLRLEQFYVGKGVTIIDKIEMEWAVGTDQIEESITIVGPTNN